jgi:hypothetical protein
MPDDAPSRLLSVGVLLQLMIPSNRDELQCCATLLGWKEPSFLISDLPFHNGRAVDFRTGTPCVVRYLISGKVVGYRSEIRKGQFSPEPLLFLSYPTRIEEILLRKHPRVPFSQPVSVTRAREHSGFTSPFPESPVIAVLHDLSVAGCRLAIAEPVAGLVPGAALKLEFDLPGIGHISHLTGVVKNLSPRSRKLLVGLEFQFYQTEYIEFRGWGGTVQKAIEQYVAQRSSPAYAADGS